MLAHVQGLVPYALGLASKWRIPFQECVMALLYESKMITSNFQCGPFTKHNDGNRAEFWNT